MKWQILSVTTEIMSDKNILQRTRATLDSVTQTKGQWTMQVKESLAKPVEELLQWLRINSNAIHQILKELRSSILHGLSTIPNGNKLGADLLASQDLSILEQIVMDPSAAMLDRMYSIRILKDTITFANISQMLDVDDRMDKNHFKAYVFHNCGIYVGKPIQMAYYMRIALLCLVAVIRYRIEPSIISNILTHLHEFLRKHGKKDAYCCHSTIAMSMLCEVVHECWETCLQRFADPLISGDSTSVFQAMVNYMDFISSIEHLRGLCKRKAICTLKMIQEHTYFGPIRELRQEIADKNAQALLRELEEAAQSARPSRPKKKKKQKKKPTLDLSDEDDIVVVAVPDFFTTEECVMCLDAEPSVLFAACRHKVCCGPCAERIRTVCASLAACPYCREPI